MAETAAAAVVTAEVEGIIHQNSDLLVIRARIVSLAEMAAGTVVAAEVEGVIHARRTRLAEAAAGTIVSAEVEGLVGADAVATNVTTRHADPHRHAGRQ